MNNNLKYFLYARKSTESDERQVQSLEDQITIMKNKAKTLWIDIIEIFQESMSAKAPWRYKFNEMIQRINNWEAKGIIAWKLDRLSRNPIDSWTIQYMLQSWILDKVITNDKEYNPIDAWLLMSVENWMSNQFIIDLKKNVKRWMDSKVDKWIFPWQAPEWYINNKEYKTIEVDEDNFSLIRRAWKLMMTWTYTVPQILKLINNSWWYKRKKKNWWKQLSQSWLYAIFKNPFYTGSFLWRWEVKEWTHKAMITWQEYERVQNVLWKNWRAIRWKTKEFAFTWMVKCWECWGSIVAEEKNKFIKSSQEIKTYVYYRCSKRKKWCNCSQKTINLDKLEEQINNILDSVEILPEFKQWWLKYLKEEIKDVLIEKQNIIYWLEKNIKILEKKLDILFDYLMDETIDKDDYDKRKLDMKKQLNNYKTQLKKSQGEKDDSIEYTEDTIDFIVNVRDKFNNWSLKTKKLIFSFLGENFILKDGVLTLELHPWLLPIQKKIWNIKREYRRLELKEKSSSKVNTKALNELIPLWYSQLESNQRLPLRRGLFYPLNYRNIKKVLRFYTNLRTFQIIF